LAKARLADHACTGPTLSIYTHANHTSIGVEPASNDAPGMVPRNYVNL
jgi:hypothetical protein